MKAVIWHHKAEFIFFSKLHIENTIHNSFIWYFNPTDIMWVPTATLVTLPGFQDVVVRNTKICIPDFFIAEC